MLAFFCGYPERNLEPLQIVRYHAGEFTSRTTTYTTRRAATTAAIVDGNRHFTFLVYLNAVEGKGEGGRRSRGFNLTVTPVAIRRARLQQLLRRAVPDERSLHEANVAPTKGIQVRHQRLVSRHLFADCRGPRATARVRLESLTRRAAALPLTCYRSRSH